jgi:peptidoglycan-associated lipoprotein
MINYNNYRGKIMKKILVLSVVWGSLVMGACAHKPKGHGNQLAQVEQAASVATLASSRQGQQGDQVETWSEHKPVPLQDESPPTATPAAVQPILSRVHFSFDTNILTKVDKSQLQTIATRLLQNASLRLRIEGNTDERGSREYNIALGERRANAVADALQQMGVKRSQLVILSYGEEKPVNMAHTPKAYQENRRADLYGLVK